MRDEFKGFIGELEKQAISIGKTLAAVRGRMAQGVATVSPGTLRELEAEAARGLSTTSRGSRRAALYAAESAQDHRRMQQKLNNPVTDAFRARADRAIEAAQKHKPGVYDSRFPLASHYDSGPDADARFAYTKAHMDTLAGKSHLVDPKGLLQQEGRRALGTAPTVLTPSSLGDAKTVASGVRPSARPPVGPGGTAITRVDTPLAGRR